VFKVPTLHNVATTGPWLHDGSIASLQQVVDGMARYQSGRHLDNRDIDDIVAFLRALGDRMGMLGDCAASGRYGVDMNCSVALRGSDADQEGDLTGRAQLPDAAVLAEQHQEHYAAALNLLTAAPARIAEEMQRIRSDQVAHYDFLQYEHIEMMRHARALSFPPGNLEAEQREALLSQATEWQQSAADYELIISDFLRNHAVASSARANLQDLLRILSTDADEKVLSRLSQVEHSAYMFYSQPGPDTQLGIESSTKALQDLNLNPQRLQELQFQVRLRSTLSANSLGPKPSELQLPGDLEATSLWARY
jgi:hypothetical protein